MGVLQTNGVKLGLFTLSIVALLTIAGGAGASNVLNGTIDDGEAGVGDATVNVTLLIPENPIDSGFAHQNETQTVAESDGDKEVGFYEITELPAGKYLIRVSHEDYQSYTSLVTIEDDTEQGASLVELGSIEGVIFQGNSETGGIDNATVLAVSPDVPVDVSADGVAGDIPPENIVSETETNEEGEYAFDDLAPGEYLLVALSSQDRDGEDGVFYGVMDTEVESGETTTQHIRMNSVLNLLNFVPAP